MSETRFTEGEWVKATGIGYCCIRTGSMDSRTGKVIADMRLADGYYNPFDANLIAAAPELYEALDMLMDASGPGDASQLLAEERDNIMMLLAKARGEQP